MKTSIIAAAAVIGIASASKGGYGGGYGGSGAAFVPRADQYVQFADNIQTVSQVKADTYFLRSADLYTITPNDLALASSFTVPDFALGLNCSLNLAVPSIGQSYSDTDIVIFSGSGNLNFSRLVTNLPNSGLTFNTLGQVNSNGISKVIPGQNLVAAQFPCPPPGTQLPGLISSPAQGADTTLVVRDTFGPFGVTGLFLLIDGVSNPPVSPPPPAAPASASASAYGMPPVSTKSGYATGSAWGTASASGSFATYSSAWHS